MFKLAVFVALVACAFAAPKPGYLAAPAVYAAHTVPVATSYQHQTVIKSPVVSSYTYAAAPVLKTYSAHPAHLTYAQAAPVYSSYSAPLGYTQYAHAAPLAYSSYPAPVHAW
ncbi:larval/pupal cuticle protein H1C-like [Nasonia vitripennis]|uniref:Uncharacterized protein n=1 Tax=Nasonia vitripennis TaxID=7425 RepID=A0A7M7G7X0_NASVI|nr:larval/pupal cuticle protein H1C-like [Nasonia vitripennis]